MALNSINGQEFGCHPIGATLVGQINMTTQVRGVAAKRQAEGAELA